jgi:hypothetical protein
MSRSLYPIASSSHDGEDITLMRILEVVSATAYNYTLSNYVAADKPGTVVIKDANGNAISTLTLSYDGSNNLTSIVRS